MPLTEHRPEHLNNLSLITEWVRDRPIRDLVPSRLEEPLLLSLAMELREVERMQKGGPDVLDMSATLFLVTHLIFEGQKKQNRSDTLTIPVEEIAHATTILQLAIEREIVTRIVGVSDGKNDEGFLAGINDISTSERAHRQTRQQQRRSQRS